MPPSAPDQSTLVGKGFCADVYAWGAGRVLKLFHGLAGRERAEREFAATLAIHGTGLPVPEGFDLIEVGGRSGIVFERVDGVSLLGYSQARPWALFAVIRQFAELHAEIHRHPAPAGLPTLRERIDARIELADSSAAEKQAARDQLALLPNGDALCHGDFHPDNILLTPRGPVVIDWSSASRGDPLGDVACTSRLMQTASLPTWSPRYMHLILKSLRPVIHESYLRQSLRLHGGTRLQVEAWQPTLAVAARGWRL